MIAKSLIMVALVAASGAEPEGEQDSKEVAASPSPFAARGTWNGIPIMRTLIQRFESERRTHFIDFSPADSDQIPGLLSQHACDVGMTLDFRLREKSRNTAGGYESFKIGRFVVCVVVNCKNPARNIALQDLQGVFLGRIALWQNVSGSGAFGRVETYRPAPCTTQAMMFQKRLMLGNGCVGGDKQTDAGVVAVVIKRSDAIGFVFYPCDEHLDKRVRVLGIVSSKGEPPVHPSPSTVADGSYPFVDSLTLYLHPDAPSEARELCGFATGPKAVKIIKEFGLWPEYELNAVRGRERLADVKAGSGTEIAVCDLAAHGSALKDLSLEFVKSKATVQLKFQKGQMQEEAIENLAKGVTELLLADGESGQPSAISGQTAGNPKSKSENPKCVVLGRMEAGIIVHPENPLPSLPMDEVRSIFCGETKKWPAVRGAAAAMHVFGLKRGDPITQLLKEKLAESGGRKSLKYTAQPDNEKVILAVARDPAAIGFVDLSQLPPKEKSVKLVPVFAGSGVGGRGFGRRRRTGDGGRQNSSFILRPSPFPQSFVADADALRVAEGRPSGQGFRRVPHARALQGNHCPAQPPAAIADGTARVGKPAALWIAPSRSAIGGRGWVGCSGGRRCWTILTRRKVRERRTRPVRGAGS